MPSTRDTRRFPTEPLIDAVIKRFGSLKASPFQRQLQRLRLTGLDWRQADDWAVRCGKHPAELWPEWLDVEPVAS